MKLDNVDKDLMRWMMMWIIASMEKSMVASVTTVGDVLWFCQVSTSGGDI